MDYEVTCPLCKRKAELVTSELFYGTDYGNNIYVCRRCDAYVGTHGRSKKPMGSLAWPELRKARRMAHSMFDQMWQRGDMTRSRAYAWLGWKLNVPPEKAHIGMFDEEQCKQVWLAALRFCLTHSEIIDCPDCNGTGDVGWPERMWDYDPCERCKGTGQIQRGDIR